MPNSDDLIREIALRQGVSEERVRTEIQKAIEAAYAAPCKSEKTQGLQNRVQRQGTLPTPGEFITFVVDELERNAHPLS